MSAKKRVPAKLASARAYWRLAAKAERAGDYRTAGHYRSIGDRRFKEYQRDREAMARIKEQRGEN
jgi:hypothetical protein